MTRDDLHEVMELIRKTEVAIGDWHMQAEVYAFAFISLCPDKTVDELDTALSQALGSWDL